MARRRPAQADAPANPQTESKLLSLPPELRTIIWELVLHVEPASDGTLVLRKLSDRNEDDGEEDGDHLSSTPHSNVLTLLLTCRSILYEAAGIFYVQHPISFIHKPIPYASKFGIVSDPWSLIHKAEYRVVFDTKACVEARRFAKEVRCPSRLNGIQTLHIQADNLEDLTMLSNTISRHFPKLKTFRCKVLFEEGNVEGLTSEAPLLKRAVSRLPAGMEMFEVEFAKPDMRLWSRGAREVFQGKARKVLEGVFAKLPNGTKGEIV